MRDSLEWFAGVNGRGSCDVVRDYRTSVGDLSLSCGGASPSSVAWKYPLRGAEPSSSRGRYPLVVRYLTAKLVHNRSNGDRSFLRNCCSWSERDGERATTGLLDAGIPGASAKRLEQSSCALGTCERCSQSIVGSSNSLETPCTRALSRF